MSNQESLQAAKNIDSVTDYVEEKEDANLASNLTSIVAASRTDDAPLLKISREDIMLVAEELEIGKEEAERVLRNNGGDVKTALINFIDGV
jgi:NACalpha-BTF3-like transcription factor